MVDKYLYTLRIGIFLFLCLIFGTELSFKGYEGDVKQS